MDIPYTVSEALDSCPCGHEHMLVIDWHMSHGDERRVVCENCYGIRFSLAPSGSGIAGYLKVGEHSTLAQAVFEGRIENG